MSVLSGLLIYRLYAGSYLFESYIDPVPGFSAFQFEPIPHPLRRQSAQGIMHRPRRARVPPKPAPGTIIWDQVSTLQLEEMEPVKKQAKTIRDAYDRGEGKKSREGGVSEKDSRER